MTMSQDNRPNRRRAMEILAGRIELPAIPAPQALTVATGAEPRNTESMIRETFRVVIEKPGARVTLSWQRDEHLRPVSLLTPVRPPSTEWAGIMQILSDAADDEEGGDVDFGLRDIDNRLDRRGCK